jgi:hypothetical protein
VCHALALVFDDIGTRLPVYKEKATEYRAQLRAAWDELSGRLVYDYDDDGLQDADEDGQAVSAGGVFLL